LPAIAWDNASQAILERSLDDSANRRLFQAESFLAMEEMVQRMDKVVQGMVMDEQAMARNMATYGPLAATERVLMALVKAGGSRQDGHEWIREASLQAWTAVQQNQPNPLANILATDERITQYLSLDDVRSLMVAEAHVGTAVDRALALAQQIKQL
jgi:adenylosuccinate lyase